MRYLNLHTHSASGNDDVLEIINRYPHEVNELPPFYSIGIHPWYIDKDNLEQQMMVIDISAAHPGCLAIGECGLDSRIETPVELQEPVFKSQLEIAMKHGKPVVLHLVGAFDRLIAIKRELNPNVPLIIHGFSKSSEMAQQLEKEGFYLSFGKYLLRNPGLREAFEAVSTDRIFLETDTAEETIAEVYQKASSYRGCSVEEMKQTIAQNFNTVFGRNLS